MCRPRLSCSGLREWDSVSGSKDEIATAGKTVRAAMMTSSHEATWPFYVLALVPAVD